jgi:hypothetical protein
MREKKLVLLKIICITVVEKEWLKNAPNVLVSPLFAENVSRIELTRDVMDRKNFGSNGFTHHLMKRKCIMILCSLTCWTIEVPNSSVKVLKLRK